MIYALDSNIVSYTLKEDAKVVAQYRQALKDDCEMAIPPIVYFEVQRGLLAKRLTKFLAAFDKLHRSALRIEFDMPTWERAAQISALLYHRASQLRMLTFLLPPTASSTAIRSLQTTRATLSALTA